MTRMSPDRRASARDPICVPVVLADGRRAATRNLSSSGIYLVVEGAGRIDPWLSFDFAVPGAGLRFVAAAEVLRIERQHDGGTGIALKLHGSRLEALG